MPGTIKLGKAARSAPIKGYSHRGFVTGWCAIMVVGIMAFGLLTLPLGYSSADLSSAEEGAVLTSAR